MDTMDKLPSSEEDTAGEYEKLSASKNSPNIYAAKKTVAQGMMDVALITANANQLRFILEYNRESNTFVLAVTLIIISLLLQVVVGVFLIFKGRYNLQGEEKLKQANMMNNYVVGGVFLITIINVFAAAFSTSPSTPTFQPTAPTNG